MLTRALFKLSSSSPFAGRTREVRLNPVYFARTELARRSPEWNRFAVRETHSVPGAWRP